MKHFCLIKRNTIVRIFTPIHPCTICILVSIIGNGIRKALTGLGRE